MLNGEKVIVKNGLKKDYIVYKKILPEFSAIHTKLCGDGMEVEEDLLYLLGNGYALELADGKLELFNSTFLNDLCGSLGIYLEEFMYTDKTTYFEEVKRNSIINIAPPMVYVNFEEGTYLSIVCSTSQQSQYEIINPVSKKVELIDTNRINYLLPWYMMNSPRFMKPVFRNRKEMIRCSIYKLVQTYQQMRSIDHQIYYSFDRNEIAKKIAKNGKLPKMGFRELFINSLRHIEKLMGCPEGLKEYKTELLQMWKVIAEEEQWDNRYKIAVEICKLEEKIMKIIEIGAAEIIREGNI